LNHAILRLGQKAPSILSVDDHSRHAEYQWWAGTDRFGNYLWRANAEGVDRTRKTDKVLPRYCDGEGSDIFILCGVEDLADPEQDGARKQYPPAEN
jgi:hypothetical protein